MGNRHLQRAKVTWQLLSWAATTADPLAELREQVCTGAVGSSNCSGVSQQPPGIPETKASKPPFPRTSGSYLSPGTHHFPASEMSPSSTFLSQLATTPNHSPLQASRAGKAGRPAPPIPAAQHAGYCGSRQAGVRDTVLLLELTSHHMTAIPTDHGNLSWGSSLEAWPAAPCNTLSTLEAACATTLACQL